MATSPLSAYKFRLLFTGAWVCLILLHLFVLVGLGFTLIIAFTDSFVTNTLLAAACILISNNLQYYIPRKEKQWYILIFSACLSGLWLFLIHLILVRITFSSHDYILFLKNSLTIRFGVAFLLITFMAVVSVLWYTVEDQKKSDRRKADLEKLAREAELYNLRQQLQPHFLFNSLNSINALISSRPDEARRMILQLSDFLRGTLNKEENQFLKFSEELKYLQLYLDIERVRFEHRLEIQIEKDEKCGEMKLPVLLLQPLVENAIKFGLYATSGDVIIRIKAAAEEKQLIISVQNPFDPETSELLQGTGFGLSSIRRRLQLLFGRNDLLLTHAEDHLFTAMIKIPQ